MTNNSKAIILTIGTEITRGELVDSNSAWIAEQLTAEGYDVLEIISVADNDLDILETFKRVSQKAHLVITTGGLGPTSDDRTTQIVCDFMNVELLLDRKSEEKIRSLVEARGRKMTESNRKQSYFPAGSTILENCRGTAPGFFVDFNVNTENSCRLFFMPGVPNEMKGMFKASVLPVLPDSCSWTAVRKLQSCGVSESDIGDRLFHLEQEFDVTIGYRASAGRIEIKVLKSGPRSQKQSIEQACDAAFDAIRHDLGSAVMGIGRKNLAEILVAELSKHQFKIAFAESCTGGMAGEILTSVPGSSEVFKGAMTCYSNESKSELLGVNPKIIEEFGAVSSECAQAMSEGVRENLGVDCAISWTGIAGPGGGSEAKPVGLVYFSIVTPQRILNFHRTFLGGRQLIRQYAVNAGFFRLIQALREDEKVSLN